MARVADRSGNGGRGNTGAPDPRLNPTVAMSGQENIPITTSDSRDQLEGSIFRGFYASGAGNLAFLDEGGNTCLMAISANQQYAQRVRRFLATNTTATGIVGVL